MNEQADQPMSWQDQLLDVLTARARTWFVVSILLILLGALLAILAPSTLPPTPFFGVVIGVVSVLLATAAVFALDVSDVIVRGRRHVEIAGGTVAGTISRATSDIDALVDLIDRHAQDGKVRVALTPASRSAGVPGSRANIVATELAGRGAKVLVTDLTRGGTPAVGLSDVITGERTLGEAVRFDDELYLAHLAVGSEPELALEGFSAWSRGLPPDLDVLVAALPPLSEPGVLPAVDGVELVLLLVEVGRTERVDLIASLDAIDAAEVPAELVLVDDEVVAAPTTGSGSVEVLSTPGSSPRQRDPAGFDLRDDSSVVVTDAAAEHEPEPEDDPTTGTATAGPGAAMGGGLGAGRTSTPTSLTGGGGATGAGAAAGAAAGSAAAAVGAAGMSSGSDDADLRTGGTAAVSDEFDEDDDGPVQPGGGHVRTVRRRANPAPVSDDVVPGTDDTVAMSPADLAGGGAPLAPSAHDDEQVAEEGESTVGIASAGRDDPDATQRLDPVDLPDAGEPGGPGVPPAVVGSDDEPDMVDEPDAAHEPRVAEDPVHDESAQDSIDDVSGHHDQPDVVVVDDPGPGPAATDHLDDVAQEPAGDVDDDPIDAVAREQQRLSASLQQLAQDVWRRGDGT